jgi:hypothetical protein
MPWLTPDSDTWSLVCVQIHVPDDDTLRAALRGLLLDLERVQNWEQFGTATPEEVAAAWEAANEYNLDLNECPP